MKKLIEDSTNIDHLMEGPLEDVILNLKQLKNMNFSKLKTAYTWDTFDRIEISRIWDNTEILIHGKRYETNFEYNKRIKKEEKLKNKNNEKAKSIKKLAKQYNLDEKTIEMIVKSAKI